MIRSPEQEVVDAVITSRHSIRAFLPKPVAREDIEAILTVAGRAPSGANIQPWKVYVVSGAAKDKLSQDIQAASVDPALSAQHVSEYQYYPLEWRSPFIERRRKIGWDLYALLGLARDNKSGMQQQHLRNFTFFDAPVGLLFTIDRVLEQGSWLDYGMFLQNIMIAARSRGLDTCSQGAFIHFHKIIAEALQFPANEQFVCAMSIGYADPDKIENSLVTEREPVQNFVRFIE